MIDKNLTPGRHLKLCIDLLPGHAGHYPAGRKGHKGRFERNALGMGLLVAVQSRAVKCGGADQGVQICTPTLILPLKECIVTHLFSLFRESAKQSKPILALQVIDQDVVAPVAKGGGVKILI